MARNGGCDILASLPTETMECFKAVKVKMIEEGGPLFNEVSFIIPDSTIAAFCVVEQNDVDSVYRHLRKVLEGFLFDRSFPVRTLSPSNMDHILHSQKAVRILKGKTSKGKAVIVLNPAEWNWCSWSQEDLLRLSVLFSRDFMVNSSPAESVGAVFIFDWGKYNYWDAKFWLAFLFSKGKLLRGFPSFGPEVHCVNNSKIVQHMVSKVLRLLPKEIGEKLRFHKHGYQDLRTYIDPEILPAELGGDLEDGENAYESTYERIMKDEETYQKLNVAVEKARRDLKLVN